MLREIPLSPAHLNALCRDRQVYLWGASIVGFGVCRALERHGIKPTGFIDRSSRLRGKGSLGYSVSLPEQVLPGFRANPHSALVIMTSGHYEHQIAQACMEAGLVEGEDFISARQLSPLDPSVDISGVCNLRCMSCPRGNMPIRQPVGFMDPQTYGKVLDKLLHELPLVGNIQLYAWGEPLLNPDAAKIIRMTVERQLLCAISTNLNIRRDFSEVIKARPDWMKISLSGYEESYELTHTGGNWRTLLNNMKKLKTLKDEHHPNMYVEVNYHLYKHNLGDDYQRMQSLCEDLDFAFRPNYAYLYPLDNVAAYREGRELTEESNRTLDLLLLNIDEGIARALAEKDLPCAEERCLPINWNLNVRFCGAYFEPVLVENFLDLPIAEIIDRRNKSPFCRKCRSMALHRYTSVYLEERALSIEASK